MASVTGRMKDAYDKAAMVVRGNCAVLTNREYILFDQLGRAGLLSRKLQRCIDLETVRRVVLHPVGSGLTPDECREYDALVESLTPELKDRTPGW